jgi:hypothetical protein
MHVATWRTALFLLVCTCPAGSPAAAQTGPDDPVSSARARFGPVGLNPSIALHNFGIDNNVFLDETGAKKDLTFTLSPAVESWLRAGASRLNVNGHVDLIYYRHYSSERSVDGRADARFEIRTRRLTPWIGGAIARQRQRVGYEIDLRSLRDTRDVELGLEVNAFSKMRVDFAVQRSRYAYDRDDFFRGTNLDELLNRTSELASVQLRHSLTPLTTFVVQGEAIRDEFTFSPERDANSVRVRAGFDLSPFALISGRVRVGYRKFDPVSSPVSGYAGLIGSANVAYVFRGRLRIEGELERDVTYSYEPMYPFYLLSGATLQVTERFSPRWDVQGRAGRHWLAYQGVPGAAQIERTDWSRSIGAGLGFNITRESRVSLNADQITREAVIPGRNHRTLRVWTAVTYGR